MSTGRRRRYSCSAAIDDCLGVELADGDCRSITCDGPFGNAALVGDSYPSPRLTQHPSGCPAARRRLRRGCNRLLPRGSRRWLVASHGSEHRRLPRCDPRRFASSRTGSRAATYFWRATAWGARPDQLAHDARRPVPLGRCSAGMPAATDDADYRFSRPVPGPAPAVIATVGC